MIDFGTEYANETGDFQARVAEQERASQIEAAHNILGSLCPQCGGIDGMETVPPWAVEKYTNEKLWRRGNTLNVPCLDCNPAGVVPAEYEMLIIDSEGVYDEHFWFQD